MGNGNQARRAMWAAALLATTAMAGTVWTSPAAAQDVAQRAFDIPAQPLPSALTLFGRQSGLQVSVPAALAQGRTSSAVSGSMAPLAALSQLLAGTGLTYRISGNIVTLEPAPEASSGAIQLGPVRVEGQSINQAAQTLADKRGSESPTGPGLGYVANRSLTATKTDTPLIETARTVTVITRDQMDAQQAQSIRDTMRYAPGIYYSDDADFRYEPVNARGFALDQYLDGLSLLAGTWAVPRVDPYFLERAEVLEGPASTLYGQGSPGGLLDMVSKRPTDTPLHEIELQTGSYGRVQGAVDMSGPLDKDGNLLYRVTGLFRDTGTQVDHVRQERIAVAPSLTWRLDADTSFTLLASYLRDPKAGFWNLLPYQGTLFPIASGKISRSFYLGDPSFEKYTFNQAMAGYQLKHRFNDDWSFQQDFRYTHISLDYEEFQGYSLESDQRTLDRYAYTANEHLNTITLDNQVAGHFSTGALSHAVLIGLDYQHYDWNNLTRYGDAPSLDILNPDYSQTIPLPGLFQSGHQTHNQTGIYAQDQVRFSHFIFTLGGRQDWANLNDYDRLASARTKQSENAFTWHTELLYHFDQGFAPYFSYATSFQPTTGTDAEGSPFKPTKGEQEEIGLKYQPHGWNALFTASAFNLTQQNVLTTDPNNQNYQVQTGKVRSRGIELSAVASPIQNLSIRASYTYLGTKIVETNDGTAGNILANTPKNFGSLWGDYTINDGVLSGFGFSVGGRYIGKSYTTNTNTYRIPDYALFDAAIHYDLGQLYSKIQGTTLRVNVTNLADKKYVSYCTGIGCRWGEGRTVYASVRYRW